MGPRTDRVPPVTLTLLPAVDVTNGQAVRLTQGAVDTETTYGSPLEAALAFQGAGAEWIHLVDLDAAFGRGSNLDLLAQVIGALDVPVELSAGVRDDATLSSVLATGCARVVVGTGALGDPGWCARVIESYGERIAVSLDARIIHNDDGVVEYRLAARGGSGITGDFWETIAWLDQRGCARYIVTDVERDGMLNGPNVDLYRSLGRATGAPFIASGGVSTISDLHTLAGLSAGAAPNLEGAIVGKALYAGRFTLDEAVHAVRRIAT